MFIFSNLLLREFGKINLATEKNRTKLNITTLRNESVLASFINQRQSLEDLIAMENGPEHKILRRKFDMICHTKNINNEGIELDGEAANDNDLLDVSNFISNQF